MKLFRSKKKEEQRAKQQEQNRAEYLRMKEVNCTMSDEEFKSIPEVEKPIEDKSLPNSQELEDLVREQMKEETTSCNV